MRKYEMNGLKMVKIDDNLYQIDSSNQNQCVCGFFFTSKMSLLWSTDMQMLFRILNLSTVHILCVSYGNFPHLVHTMCVYLMSYENDSNTQIRHCIKKKYARIKQPEPVGLIVLSTQERHRTINQIKMYIYYTQKT